MAQPPLPHGEDSLTRGSAPGTPRWVVVFGTIGVILIVLVVLMLTGVFGEGHGPGRHMGGARDDSRPSDLGGPAEQQAATRMIEVNTLDRMAFTPEAISVSAGETVTFTVRNAGKAVHEFTLGDASMQREHAQAMAHMPAGVDHAFPNSITLQPGEVKQLTWRFGAAGTFEYACHQPGHYQSGMRGRIVIT